jgi:hypothetical protein
MKQTHTVYETSTVLAKILEAKASDYETEL